MFNSKAGPNILKNSINRSGGFLSRLDQDEKVLSFKYLSNDDELPSFFEIEEAIKKLNKYKSAGIDEISNEQLNYSSGLLPWLKDLFEAVWKV